MGRFRWHRWRTRDHGAHSTELDRPGTSEECDPFELGVHFAAHSDAAIARLRKGSRYCS